MKHFKKIIYRNSWAWMRKGFYFYFLKQERDGERDNL